MSPNMDVSIEARLAKIEDMLSQLLSMSHQTPMVPAPSKHVVGKAAELIALARRDPIAAKEAAKAHAKASRKSNRVVSAQ